MIVVLLLVFIAIWIWAWLPHHKKVFGNLARLPLQDDRAPLPDIEERRP
jgi:cytochrome c oxidase cbb3-type subunit 4